MYQSKKITVKLETSRTIKPSYEGTPPDTNDYVHLTPFDTVTYDSHIAIIYAYRPPTPTNATLLMGLQKALGVFREWAGRLSYDHKAGGGTPVVLLNDAGVTFSEASVEAELDQLMPLKPSSFLLDLHPDIDGIEELLQVQVTRFTCGSMVVGFTAHHFVADGHASSNFLVAWGQACKGLDIDPIPLRRDETLFKPREPPMIEFEHRGVEFMSREIQETENDEDHDNYNVDAMGIKVEQVHFSLGFLAKLKANASSMNRKEKPFSTFETLVAHLWRTITKARGLSSSRTTNVKISINGRMRMNPRVPDHYFGNLVLWSYPTAKVNDLIREPLSYSTKLIHDTVAKVNDSYFKSFIDFATHVKEENLVSTADMNKLIELPNIEVTSWLRFPFYDLDFGGGCPYVFMPSYCPSEGTVFLLPSFIGDGSIDCFISLFQDHLASFKKICYELH